MVVEGYIAYIVSHSWYGCILFYTLHSDSIAEFKLKFFACSYNIVVHMDNCSLHFCCSTVCTCLCSMCTFYSSTFVTCQYQLLKVPRTIAFLSKHVIDQFVDLISWPKTLLISCVCQWVTNKLVVTGQSCLYFWKSIFWHLTQCYFKNKIYLLSMYFTATLQSNHICC